MSGLLRAAEDAVDGTALAPHHRAQLLSMLAQVWADCGCPDERDRLHDTLLALVRQSPHDLRLPPIAAEAVRATRHASRARGRAGRSRPGGVGRPRLARRGRRRARRGVRAPRRTPHGGGPPARLDHGARRHREGLARTELRVGCDLTDPRRGMGARRPGRGGLGRARTFVEQQHGGPLPAR